MGCQVLGWGSVGQNGRNGAMLSRKDFNWKEGGGVVTSSAKEFWRGPDLPEAQSTISAPFLVRGGHTPAAFAACLQHTLGMI